MYFSAMYRLRCYRKAFLSLGASNNGEMAKKVFIHTRLSRAYLALARLSCSSEILALYKSLTYLVTYWQLLRYFVRSSRITAQCYFLSSCVRFCSVRHRRDLFRRRGSVNDRTASACVNLSVCPWLRVCYFLFMTRLPRRLQSSILVCRSPVVFLRWFLCKTLAGCACSPLSLLHNVT